MQLFIIIVILCNKEYLYFYYIKYFNFNKNEESVLQINNVFLEVEGK